MEATLNQITELLALPAKSRRAVSDPADLEPYLREGLSGAALQHLHKALATSVAEFVPLVGISPRHFHSLVSMRKRLDMPTSDRLYRLAQVVAEATTVFGSRPKAVQWLQTPLQALGGDTPMARLGTEIGAARVLELLSAVDHGVYV